MTTKLTEYDPDASINYGKWHCPSCNATFFGGGEALHSKGCELGDGGYSTCTYLFTKKEVQRLKLGSPVASIAAPGWFTLDYLREHHPDLV